MEKQATEQRRTFTFLRYALGKREEKSVEQIQADMKMKSYTPKNDSLMSRLFRKYNPNASRSVISNSSVLLSKKGGLNNSINTYDNN